MDRAGVRSARRGLTIAASVAAGISAAAGLHAATAGPARRTAIADAALASPAVTGPSRASLAAQRPDGTLIVGRGVPASWLRPGHAPIRLANVPLAGGGHLALTITTRGDAVTLALTGRRLPARVQFELPAFAGNIARTSAGRFDLSSGVVTLPASARTVTVTLRHAAIPAGG